MNQTDLQGETERALRAAILTMIARWQTNPINLANALDADLTNDITAELLPLFNAGMEQARIEQDEHWIDAMGWTDLVHNGPYTQSDRENYVKLLVDSVTHNMHEEAPPEQIATAVAGAYAAAANKGRLWDSLRNAADARQAQPPDLKHETLSHTRNCGSLIGEDCSCGLEWRQHLQTEQTMHAAWRKRAEEAESAIASAEARARQDLRSALNLLERQKKMYEYNAENHKRGGTLGPYSCPDEREINEQRRLEKLAAARTPDSTKEPE